MPRPRPLTAERPTPDRSRPLAVAIDAAPLHGHRTGVGLATASLVRELERRDDVTTSPYLVSFRARPRPGERRLPLPAAAAMRAWASGDRPRVDRWLHGTDVVHGTNYVAPPSRLPTVISVYDCWFLAHPEQASSAVRRAGRVLRRAAARGARIHVSSHATARTAGELLGTDRVSVVHLGPPDPPAATHPAATRPTATGGPAGSAPFLLAVGTTERRKDVPALVRAFDRLAPRHPELRLVVAGAPGDHHDDVLRAVAESRVAERVHVLGAVDTATRDRLLSTATALVYPSLDEGFGFPILEAQQAGTPVVARPSGSIPEVGGDGVALAADGTLDALVEAIVTVVDDDDRRAELIRAGQANVARFSWERTADELVGVYRLACEEAG